MDPLGAAGGKSAEEKEGEETVKKRKLRTRTRGGRITAGGGGGGTIRFWKRGTGAVGVIWGELGKLKGTTSCKKGKTRHQNKESASQFLAKTGDSCRLYQSGDVK